MQINIAGYMTRPSHKKKKKSQFSPGHLRRNKGNFYFDLGIIKLVLVIRRFDASVLFFARVLGFFLCQAFTTFT